MLAGWRNKRDQEVYFKPIMSELTTISGYIKDPTIEMLVGCERFFQIKLVNFNVDIKLNQETIINIKKIIKNVN